MKTAHPDTLLIHNAEINGIPGLQLLIESGHIRAIGGNLSPEPRPHLRIDAKGGALLPGLTDHHIHLLATAAKRASLSAEHVTSFEELATLIRNAACGLSPGEWLRVTELDTFTVGIPDKDELDRIESTQPIRIQDRTGALWILNSCGLSFIDSNRGDHLPEGVERNKAGQLTGRIWRESEWLKDCLKSPPPDLERLGAELSSLGVTSVTDASVSTTQEMAGVLGRAHKSGTLPQRLRLMSGGKLTPCEVGSFEVGETKVLLDERSLVDFDEFGLTIRRSREQGRRVAVHCVTAVELSYCLAAFETYGAYPGDRIEHGSIIPKEAIPPINKLGLAVVTQPGFLHARGERYLARVDPCEQEDLYRCASLVEQEIPVAFSSDAPYGPIDPWLAMRTATDRLTETGHPICLKERIPAARALDMYLGTPPHQAARARQVRVGTAADLCLLKLPLVEALSDLSRHHVAATFINGRIVFQSDCTPS
ncbi:amidohydrolase family protein [Henriciella mobilis]|uniref:Amidohydrolase n=1 Tax=Henriciella mobilis TaxID=2305467 RepID=A0A399R5E6_9PROT|nr:amidohydrolase family protein [Henriciella mobilis]RIJ26836.1 amidohydrolase [Henriciella mobilis]